MFANASRSSLCHLFLSGSLPTVLLQKIYLLQKFISKDERIAEKYSWVENVVSILSSKMTNWSMGSRSVGHDLETEQ